MKIYWGVQCKGRKYTGDRLKSVGQQGRVSRDVGMGSHTNMVMGCHWNGDGVSVGCSYGDIDGDLLHVDFGGQLNGQLRGDLGRGTDGGQHFLSLDQLRWRRSISGGDGSLQVDNSGSVHDSGGVHKGGGWNKGMSGNDWSVDGNFVLDRDALDYLNGGGSDGEGGSSAQSGFQDLSGVSDDDGLGFVVYSGLNGGDVAHSLGNVVYNFMGSVGQRCVESVGQQSRSCSHTGHRNSEDNLYRGTNYLSCSLIVVHAVLNC